MTSDGSRVESAATRLATELGAPALRAAPRFAPMLCERDATDTKLLDDDSCLFELKLDGVRIIADRRGERVSLSYRGGRDATTSYPEIVRAVRELEDGRVVLDGEIIALDDEGRPDFGRLGTRIQSAGRTAAHAATKTPVVYVVFDVLAVGDRDVRGLPIEARRRVLEVIVPPGSGFVRLHPSFDAGGRQLFQFCREHGLEGVVAKRRGSTYRGGERTGDWTKVKCTREEDFVVVGWSEGTGRRGSLGALDLATYEGAGLVARGSVGSGLDGDTLEALLALLRQIEVPASVVTRGTLAPKRGRHFVTAELVVSVRFSGITAEGLLRHPVFRGVRPDVRAGDLASGPPKRSRAKLPE